MANAVEAAGEWSHPAGWSRPEPRAYWHYYRWPSVISVCKAWYRNHEVVTLPEPPAERVCQRCRLKVAKGG